MSDCLFWLYHLQWHPSINKGEMWHKVKLLRDPSRVYMDKDTIDQFPLCHVLGIRDWCRDAAWEGRLSDPTLTTVMQGQSNQLNYDPHNFVLVQWRKCLFWLHTHTHTHTHIYIYIYIYYIYIYIYTHHRDKSKFQSFASFFHWTI